MKTRTTLALLLAFATAPLTTFAASASAPDPSAPDPSPTRVIETGRGPVEVPATATRVVAADYYGQYPLVDLGVVPVGIVGGAPYNDPYASAVADAAVVGDWDGPFLEPIAALEPDLILRTVDTDDGLYAGLSVIAPTVEISFQQLSFEEVMLEVGAAVGRTEQAEALVAAYHVRAEQIAADHAEVIATTRWATLSPLEGGQWFLLSPAWPDNVVLGDAGIRFADAVVELGETSDDYAVERSLEAIALLADADVILVPADTEGEIDVSMAEIVDSAIWQTLPAVQAGNVFAAPSGTSSLGMAAELLDRVDEIIPQIAPVER